MEEDKSIIILFEQRDSLCKEYYRIKSYIEKSNIKIEKAKEIECGFTITLLKRHIKIYRKEMCNIADKIADLVQAISIHEINTYGIKQEREED